MKPQGERLYKRGGLSYRLIYIDKLSMVIGWKLPMIEVGTNLFNQGNNIVAYGVENQAYNNANQAQYIR